MKAKELSNNQLFALRRFPRLPDEMTTEVHNEYLHRQFSNEFEDKLNQDYLELTAENSDEDYDLTQKLLLIFIPIYYPFHCLIYKNSIMNKRKWKTYWKCVKLGLLFWTICTILIAKYLIFPEA